MAGRRDSRSGSARELRAFTIARTWGNLVLVRAHGVELASADERLRVGGEFGRPLGGRFSEAGEKSRHGVHDLRASANGDSANVKLT